MRKTLQYCIHDSWKSIDCTMGLLINAQCQLTSVEGMIYITSIHSFTILSYLSSITHTHTLLIFCGGHYSSSNMLYSYPLQTTHNSCLKVRNTRSFPFDEIVQILHRPWNTRGKSKFLYRKKLRETMGTQGAKMDEIRWQPVVQGWEVTLLPIYRNAEMIEVFAEEKRTPTFLTWGDFVICSASKTTWWLNNLSETKTQVKVDHHPQVSGQTPPEKNDSLLSRQSSKSWAIGFFKNQHPNIQKFASI